MKGVKLILTAIAAVLSLCSCEGLGDIFAKVEDRKVLLLYADGFNNLAGAMASDINALAEDAPTSLQAKRYKLLVFSHSTASGYNYKVPNRPVLVDIYKKNNRIIRDTIMVYDATNTSDVEMVRTVLNDVREIYPAKEYGMVYSSHGTGWLPREFYGSYKTDDDIFDIWGTRPSAIPYDPAQRLFEEPLVKSLGCGAYYEDGKLRTHEMELRDLPSAFPFKLDYLILDACLMGGVEVYYELRDCARYLIASQEEILSDGFYYEGMLDRVFYGQDTDLPGVCEDFCRHLSSATVNMVDCSRVGGLASVCSELFEKYRGAIADVDASKVQGYFTTDWNLGPRHWFYDLRDILAKAGAEPEDLAALDGAIDACSVFRKASEKGVSNKFEIKEFSGFSMYLPNKGCPELDEHYRELEWNLATGLVK